MNIMMKITYLELLQGMVDRGELIVSVFHKDGTATVISPDHIVMNGDAIQIEVNEGE